MPKPRSWPNKPATECRRAVAAPAECACDPNAASALDPGAQRGAAALSYGGPLGHEPLREEVARFFARDQDPAIGADHFVLANGAAGAIDLACSALLDPDDVVVTEVPAFSGSLRTIRGHGARLVGVPMDAHGMCIDRLDATLGTARRSRHPGQDSLRVAHLSQSHRDHDAGRAPPRAAGGGRPPRGAAAGGHRVQRVVLRRPVAPDARRAGRRTLRDSPPAPSPR